MLDPESIVEAGQMLVGLGRHIQRTYPKATTEGAQFGEDKILAGILGTYNGVYIDIGAHHPVENSNTWFFYSQRHWSGLLVEPLPDVWPNLMLTRPRDCFFPGAASNEDGYATLHCCRSVSSLKPDWRDDNEFGIPVRTETLRSILQHYPDTDWRLTDLLSIDVEGWEKQVIEGIPWEIVKPKVIIIEYASQTGENISGEWLPLLKAQGYKIHSKNALNMILQRA